MPWKYMGEEAEKMTGETQTKGNQEKTDRIIDINYIIDIIDIIYWEISSKSDKVPDQ